MTFKSSSLLALSLLSTSFASPAPQQTNSRERPGSIACSEVCGGLFICASLDPTAAICSRPADDFNKSYKSCHCGDATQPNFESWPQKPKLALKPDFPYCKTQICTNAAISACSAEKTESAGCTESKARHAKNRESCACSSAPSQGQATILPIARRFRREFISDPPTPKDSQIGHIQPYPNPQEPSKNPGVGHILPYPYPSVPKTPQTGHIQPYPYPPKAGKSQTGHILPYPYPAVPKNPSQIGHIQPYPLPANPPTPVEPKAHIQTKRSPPDATIKPFPYKPAEATIKPVKKPEATILPVNLVRKPEATILPWNPPAPEPENKKPDATIMPWNPPAAEATIKPVKLGEAHILPAKLSGARIQPHAQ